jgi:hypothetical protein
MSLSRLRALPFLLVVSAMISACGGFQGIVTPTLSSITPTTVASGSAAFTLTATGTNFDSGTQILWDGVAQATTVVSSTELTAAIAAPLIAAPGTISIRAIKPDTTTSNTMQLTVTGTTAATFSLTSISPSSVAAGSPAFTLTATGVGFVTGSQIALNGTGITTTFVSATELQATVPAASVATPGAVVISVLAPNNASSNDLILAITGTSEGTPPTLTSLSPSTCFNGIAGLTLTANGTNFVSGSQIVWNGTVMTTTFGSSTSISANIPAAFLTTVSVANVFVLNPDNLISNILPFTITVNPSTTPTLTSISPTKAAVGSPAFTMTLIGTDFAPGAVAYFGTFALPTTVNSSTQLTAQVPASELTAVAQVQVTAMNTQSNASNPIPFLVGMTILFSEVNDLAWDSARNIMYISQPTGSTSSTVKNPDTVMAIDPDTLVAEWTYSPGTGSNPDRLAISADNKYLYVGLDGNGTVERLDLGNQTYVPDITIPLGSDPNLGAYYAMDLQVDPVQSNTIAVARGVSSSVSIIQAQGGVAVYDGAVQRPSVVTPTTQSDDVLLDTIQWATNGNSIYAANNENYEGDFYQLGVTGAGVTLLGDTLNLFPTPNLKIHFDSTNQLLYGDDGLVINPVTATTAANFVAGGVMVPDSTIGNAYFVGQSSSQIQTVAYTVESFNLSNQSAVAQLPLYEVEGVPQHLIRWGATGLAFTTKKVTNCVISPCTIGDGRLYVIDGPFVTQTAP